MAYYERHIFFCCNQRDGGKTCCNDKGASAMRDYAKQRVKQLGLDGAGKMRVNQAGCLDRCEEGPCVVVYPEAVWYTYADEYEQFSGLLSKSRVHRNSIVSLFFSVTSVSSVA